MYKTNKNLKVLVIEDNDDHWVLIEKAMQHYLVGANITRTASVSATEAFLKECSVEEWNMPELILQDLDLPSSADGLMLVKHVKSLSASHKLIPIIILSSSNEQADINEAYEVGISSYCLKPTSLEGWVSFFKDLCTYWLEVATLPPKYYSLLK